MWLEARATIDEEIRKQNLMTTKELEKMATVPELKEFFKAVFKVLERWMKVMTIEEGDFASTLIVDSIMKCLILKLDAVFGIKDRTVEKAMEDCAENLQVLKAACRDKLDL